MDDPFTGHWPHPVAHGPRGFPGEKSRRDACKYRQRVDCVRSRLKPQCNLKQRPIRYDIQAKTTSSTYPANKKTTVNGQKHLTLYLLRQLAMNGRLLGQMKVEALLRQQEDFSCISIGRSFSSENFKCVLYEIDLLFKLTVYECVAADMCIENDRLKIET